MTDNVYPKRSTHKRSAVTDWLFWTVSLWSWRFKAFCKSQCKDIMLHMLLQCSLTCERIWPVWLCLSSCLSRFRVFMWSAFGKERLGCIPYFHPLGNLPRYPNFTTTSSLTKLTLNKMTSLCGHSLEEQQHWTVLENISSLCSFPG